MIKNLFCVVAITILLCAVSRGDDRKTAFVKKVYDGDTIELDGGVHVRYIGLDAPEIHHPTKPVERMGREAMEYNRSLVEGRKVDLEAGSKTKDKYGRTLAYVYVGPRFINEEILRAGMAILYLDESDTEHNEELATAETEARKAGRGIWGLPLARPEDRYVASKGGGFNKNEKNRRKVFHRPGCQFAQQIKRKNIVEFATYDHAMDRGYRPCNMCKPLERK